MAKSQSRFQLNQRTIAIGLTIILFVILGVVFWLLYSRPSDDVAVVNEAATPTNVAVVNSTIVESNTEPVETTTAPVEMTRLANFFAERYGSYTTDSNFANITNLKPYMTTAMQKNADAYVASQRASLTGAYMEVVTKVVSTTVLDSADTTATVRLTTQRVKSGDTFEENNVYYEDLVLSLVKNGDTWLINQAQWQDTEIGANPSSSSTNSNTNIEDLEDILNPTS